MLVDSVQSTIQSTVDSTKNAAYSAAEKGKSYVDTAKGKYNIVAHFRYQ